MSPETLAKLKRHSLAVSVLLDGIDLRQLLDEREALLNATQASLKVIPCLEVRSWPPGWRLKDDAIAQCTAALAKAGA